MSDLTPHAALYVAGAALGWAAASTVDVLHVAREGEHLTTWPLAAPPTPAPVALLAGLAGVVATLDPADALRRGMDALLDVAQVHAVATNEILTLPDHPATRQEREAAARGTILLMLATPLDTLAAVAARRAAGGAFTVDVGAVRRTWITPGRLDLLPLGQAAPLFDDLGACLRLIQHAREVGARPVAPPAPRPAATHAGGRA